MQAGGTLRCLRGAMARADQRKQETGMGEAAVSVLHRFWLLTRTLCILLHLKVSTAWFPNEWWDTTALSLRLSIRPMHLAVGIGGIPHLAKNERDVGHPSLVRGLGATAATGALRL